MLRFFSNTALFAVPQALEPFVAEQELAGAAPFLATTPKRWRWFRPPGGAMSKAMASVLDSHGYSVALGDVFSNDVLVGGSHGGPPPPKTVAFHVDLSLERAVPGTRAGWPPLRRFALVLQRLALVLQ